MLPVRHLALVGGLALAAACSVAPSNPTAPPRPAPTKAAAPAASPGASPAAGCGRAAGSATAPEVEQLRIGALTYNSYGFREVANRSTQDVDAGDYFFKGTFFRGAPGQKLTLRIQNTGTTAHNLSLPPQQVDRDIPTSAGRVAVDVTFPESGALRFFCKYHEAQGMNGQLLLGNGEPQPLAGAAGLGGS